jgi:hypothetical protein
VLCCAVLCCAVLLQAGASATAPTMATTDMWRTMRAGTPSQRASIRQRYATQGSSTQQFQVQQAVFLALLSLHRYGACRQ